MCFTYSLNTGIKSLESRFKTKNIRTKQNFSNVYSVNGFTFPRMPTITNSDSESINFYNWGLIPSWVKQDSKADEIRKFTLNARVETVFEKPSFKNSIINKRCLIPATGYFEWYHHLNKKKYPYLIYLASKEIFSFAGIWDKYQSDTGEIKHSFSILTVEADDYTSKIHNSKKRMPLILKQEDEMNWLDEKINVNKISDLLKTEKHNFGSYPVSNILAKRNINSNIPEILTPYNYEDLNLI